MKKSLIVGLALLSIGAFAQEKSDESHRKAPHPPAEAMEACVDLSEGDACTFTGRRGDESGVCEQKNVDQAIACKPERRKR